MSSFTSLGIIILATLIPCFLQFRPAIFSLFYHYASGKFSIAKLKDFCFFYFLGILTFGAIIFVLINLFLTFLAQTNLNFKNGIFVWATVGILIALAIISFLFYFRKGSGTELFISRSLASKYITQARSIKKPSDAFIFGFFSNLPELLFTLPLYIIAFIEIDYLSDTSFMRAASILFYTLITALPMLIIYISYQLGYNLADITKSRTRNKTFFRIFLGISYLALAIFLIVFRITL